MMPTPRARAERLALARAKIRARRWPVFPPGKRGQVLLLLGAAWILVGIAAEIVPPPPGDLPLLHVPAVVRAVLWIGSGMLALFYAWMPSNRSDAVGFLALYLMPAATSVSYLIAWVDFTVDGVGGYRYGWLSALFYFVFLSIVGICAGWREPPPLLTSEEPEVKS